MINNKIIVSGITPSGSLTLGNYFGAIKNFIKLQNTSQMFVFVANLHAITNVFDPVKLAQNQEQVVALYIACGLDPNKVVIFRQSKILEHAQLGHILLCHTTVGELSRMTQFKDKSITASNGTEFIPTGLLTYPTLMAADILLYSATHVTVGIDQKQHLELARNIAERFNKKYGKTFIVPEIVNPEIGAKIMSLTDPTKKMSKSSSDPNSMILLLDGYEKIKQKIMKAVTDSENIVRFDALKKPGISNLMTILACCLDKSIKEIQNAYKDKSYGEFKKDIVEAIWKILEPIQTKYNELISDKQKLNKMLETSEIRAREVASKKILDVQTKMGIE